MVTRKSNLLPFPQIEPYSEHESRNDINEIYSYYFLGVLRLTLNVMKIEREYYV